MDGWRASGRLGGRREEVTTTSWEQGKASQDFSSITVESFKKMCTFYFRIPLLEIYHKGKIVDVNIYLKDMQ